MTPAPKAVDRTAEEIREGLSHEFVISITAEMISRFAELSGDYSPLHCDSDYAVSRGYKGPVAHGAFQQALISQAVGMWIIGKRCLISRLSSKFVAPLIYPAQVKVQAVVQRWFAHGPVGSVECKIVDAQNGALYSESQVEVTFHGDKTPTRGISQGISRPNTANATRKTILVTGASGGIMREILPQLCESYDVIALGRDKGRLDQLLQLPAHPRWIVSHDLLDPGTSVTDILDNLRIRGPVWGVIHAASLPPARNLVSAWELPAFQKEMEMCGYVPLALARWLVKHASSDGGRMILLGSNFAIHHHPQPNSLAYGVGKSLITTMGRALAIELAKQRITVNVISPDFVPVGMNASTGERYVRMRLAANPMKRLCTPQDILHQIRGLLDENASFITGQDIILSGGMP